MDSLRAQVRRRGARPWVQLIFPGFLFAVVTERCRAASGQPVQSPVQCPLTATKATVTLTPANTSAVLSCKASDNAVAVPPNFSGQAVCSSSTITAKNCETVQFSELFPQAAGPPSWWKDAGSLQTTGATLEIPAASFPRYDQTFYLGCTSSDGNQQCVFTVEVEGKKGEQDARRVTCAYNENKTYKVVLDKTAPSFTLDCGGVGIVHPSEPADSVCSAEVTKENKCTPQQYNTIFNGYQASWWSRSQEGVREFRVPLENFPAATKTFYVACSGPKKTAGEQNYCNVAVTVNGSGEGTVTTTSTKSAAYAASHIGVGVLGLAVVTGRVCLLV